MIYAHGLFGNEYDLLSAALEAADIAWRFMELPSGAINTSDTKSRMLGYTDPSAFGHYKSYTDLLHPDDYDPTMQAMRNHLAGKAEWYEMRYRIKIPKTNTSRFTTKAGLFSKKTAKSIPYVLVRK
ncbi:MAG: PAS domain-containing protein [Candidatus Saccharimonadales bacterium]